MRLVFIRHGKTAGNLRGCYIGRTDEALCEEGKRELKARSRQEVYPQGRLFYASPMKRCIQSAAILYPGQPFRLQEDLRECDFGLFEGKNYQELEAFPYYQKWMDSNGSLPFPEGETPAHFKRRCQRAVKQIAAEAFVECGEDAEVVCVVHGGTIMAALEAFGVDGGGFYRYQVENGGGYVCRAGFSRKTELETADFWLQIRRRL